MQHNSSTSSPNTHAYTNHHFPLDLPTPEHSSSHTPQHPPQQSSPHVSTLLHTSALRVVYDQSEHVVLYEEGACLRLQHERLREAVRGVLVHLQLP